VTAGRSGQSSLTELLQGHVTGCATAFEEPSIDPHLPGRLGQYERRFRRRFFETHELLGRGKVLEAFANGDSDYLQEIARRRLRAINKRMDRTGSSIYIDVSKYFARGLHRGFLEALPGLSLIHLVRDPLKNMRSFLNRNKNFYLDNGAPNSPRNELPIDASKLNKGQLYLWAWCEIYLRFEVLSRQPKIRCAAEMRTEDLTNPEAVANFLDAMELPHDPVTVSPALNSNVLQGFPETRVLIQDVENFRNFLAMIPANVLDRISYLQEYYPEAATGKN